MRTNHRTRLAELVAKHAVVYDVVDFDTPGFDVETGIAPVVKAIADHTQQATLWKVCGRAGCDRGHESFKMLVEGCVKVQSARACLIRESRFARESSQRRAAGDVRADGRPER